MHEAPSAHTSLLTALDEWLSPPKVLAILGDAAETRRWKAALGMTLRPAALIVGIAPDVAPLPVSLDHDVPDSGAAAWLCAGATCLPPVFTLPDAENLLRE